MNKINKSLIIGSLLLVVVIPLTTWLVGKNQENRSKATSETEETLPVAATGSMLDGVCGEANGTTVKTVPSGAAACNVGAINWMDSKAIDGEYNWKCAGTIDGTIVDCSAKKQ